jgi:HK97 family phage prohead protease
MEKTLIKMNIMLKKVDVANATLEAIFSTADEDRHGEVVVQNWDLKNFKANPVILNSHNYGDATDVIGKAVSIKVIKDEATGEKRLEGDIKFATLENPKAKIIFDLYAGGFLNAFSVGFIPKEFDDTNQILKSELLEISAVSVPANAMALAKAKGIEVDKLYERSNTKHSEGEGSDEGDAIADDDSGGDRAGENNEADTGNGTGDADAGDNADTATDAKPDTDTDTEAEVEKEKVSDSITDPENKTEAKSASRKILDAFKTAEDRKLKALNKVIIAIKLINEETKADTRPAKDVRVESNRLIHKAIRSLYKLKN